MGATEKFLAGVLKYADRKTVPLFGIYALVVYYSPVIGIKTFNQLLILLGALFGLTIIYVITVYGFRQKSKSTDITEAFLMSSFSEWKSKVMNIRIDDRDKEECVRVFLIGTINSVRKYTVEFMKERDCGLITKYLINIKDEVKQVCSDHNVPMEIYEIIHEVNEKRIYHFHDVVKHLVVTKDMYSENERTNIALLALYHLLKSLIDSTIEVADELNGVFTKAMKAQKEQNRYVFPIKED